MIGRREPRIVRGVEIKTKLQRARGKSHYSASGMTTLCNKPIRGDVKILADDARATCRMCRTKNGETPW